MQRIQDEIETAKARERIQAQSSRELSPETNSGIEAAMASLREDKAASKPKAKPAQKKPAPVKKPAAPDMSTSEGIREYAKSVGYKGKYASLAPRTSYDPGESSMTPEDWQDQAALEMRGRIPYHMRQGEFKPVDRSVGRAVGVLPTAVATEKARLTPAPTINAVRDTVKPPPAAAPAPPAKLSPAQERVKGLTPAQAEVILQDTYASRGKHGQYTPEESELMDALRAKAAGFDYSKVKQAPAAPYVPSFLGGKK